MPKRLNFMECLVVVAIISIIAALLAPSIQQMREVAAVRPVLKVSPLPYAKPTIQPNTARLVPGIQVQEEPEVIVIIVIQGENGEIEQITIIRRRPSIIEDGVL